MAYEHVNGEWPSDSDAGRSLKPTEQEAITAVKLLWRKFMKRRLAIPIKITTGRRRTWIRNRVFWINPDEKPMWNATGGGWHEIIHSVSHLVAYRLHPGTKAHSTQHHFIEREMVKHVVASGWLDGKLKRTRKEKAPVDPKLVKKERIAASIKRWESKRKRADTALRKLQQKQRRLELRP